MARPGSCKTGLRSRPIERRLHNAQERIRRDQDEEIERDRDPRLHAEHVGLEARRQIAAEERDHRAEHAEDQDPQQHRAFVVAPHSADLVDQGLRRMEFSNTLTTEKSDRT